MNEYKRNGFCIEISGLQKSQTRNQHFNVEFI